MVSLKFVKKLLIIPKKMDIDIFLQMDILIMDMMVRPLFIKKNLFMKFWNISILKNGQVEIINLINHNCHDFMKELIIFLEAELIFETIPIRSPYNNFSIHQNGIYEIPMPLIDGFKSVLKKKGTNFSFSSEFDAKMENFEHNLIRCSVSKEKKGFELICLYKSEEWGGARKDFKIYFKDFIRFYEDEERIGKKVASCFEPFYFSFKNKQFNSKNKFY